MPHRNPTLTCSARGLSSVLWTCSTAERRGHRGCSFSVTLESEDAAASASPEVTERARDTSNGARRARAAKNSPPPEAEPSGGPREPQAEGPGYLFVNTRPWTKVYVDDRFIRNTPLLRHELPAGQHRLKLVNEDFNINETIAVRVVAEKDRHRTQPGSVVGGPFRDFRRSPESGLRRTAPPWRTAAGSEEFRRRPRVRKTCRRRTGFFLRAPVSPSARLVHRPTAAGTRDGWLGPRSRPSNSINSTRSVTCKLPSTKPPATSARPSGKAATSPSR